MDDADTFVPIDDDLPTGSLCGELRGTGVWISDPASVESLGGRSFGKGSLSRTIPEYRQKRKTVGNVQEHLILLLEEAFFLAFAVQCLEVVDASATKLSTSMLWGNCCALQSNFPARYACYHHARSRNWLPKSGLKFGADLMLYPLSTAAAHAAFAVVVQPLQTAGAAAPLSSWVALQGTLRVTGSVNKSLLVAQIFLIDPVSGSKLPVTDGLLADPTSFVRAARVHFLAPTRWSAALGRDGRELAAPVEL